MTTLPSPSGTEPPDDKMQRINDRFDQSCNNMDRHFDRIERTMLKRSDLYLTLIAAQMLTIGFWTIVILGLWHLGLFS